MKKLLLGLLLTLLPSLAAAQATNTTPAYCNQFYQVNQGATALTKRVTGVAGKTIGLCGVALSAGAASATFSLSYGTGTNCGTGTTTLYPVVTLAANATYVDHTAFINLPIPSVNSSGVANDLCVVTTGTGPISVILYYAQF